MPTTDPRIDAYIAKAAPFAQPILSHFRALVHRALPEVEEGIKWSMPAFMLGGKNVAGMAAFKAHCAIMIQGEGRLGDNPGMGGYGKVTALSDLPPDGELEMALQAAARRVSERGSAAKPKVAKAPKAPIPMPEDFANTLAKKPEAAATLDGFAPSHRREYLEWITEAKQAATRERRIAQAVEWLAEGKKRNWKYERC
jgi:uncharacterized protein YdeI (YjbR/CyaY-like superfamily)